RPAARASPAASAAPAAATGPRARAATSTTRSPASSSPAVAGARAAERRVEPHWDGLLRLSDVRGRIFDDLLRHLQRRGAVEAVVDALVEGPTDLQAVAHRRLAVGADEEHLLRAPDGAEQAHRAVLEQVVVGVADAERAEVGEKRTGVHRI